MTTDVCSIWAYEAIKESGYLGERLSMYLSVFTDNHSTALTAREATSLVRNKFGRGYECSSYVARLSDLTQMGFLKKHDIVVCDKSNKKVNTWIWTGRTKPLDSREELVCCNKCKGVGKVMETVYFDPDKRLTQLEFNLDER